MEGNHGIGRPSNAVNPSGIGRGFSPGRMPLPLLKPARTRSTAAEGMRRTL